MLFLQEQARQQRHLQQQGGPPPLAPVYRRPRRLSTRTRSNKVITAYLAMSFLWSLLNKIRLSHTTAPSLSKTYYSTTNLTLIDQSLASIRFQASIY